MAGVALGIAAALLAGVPASTSAPSLREVVSPYARAVTSAAFRAEGRVTAVAVVEQSASSRARALVLQRTSASWRVEESVVLDEGTVLSPGHFTAADAAPPEWVSPLLVANRTRVVVFDELDAGGWSGVVLADHDGNWAVVPVAGAGTGELSNPRLGTSGILTTATASCTPNCATGGWVDRRFRFDPDLTAFIRAGAPVRRPPSASPGAPPVDAAA